MFRSQLAATSKGVGASDELPFYLERPVTRFDGIASGAMWIGLLITIVSMGYMLWGVWSGMIADPNFMHVYSHGDRLRIVSNIHLAENIMTIASVVTLAMLVFLYYDDGVAGYAVVISAVFLNLGIPWLTSFFLQSFKSHANIATDEVVRFMRQIAWIPGIPGFVLIIGDLARRSMTGLQTAKVRRSSLTFGQAVAAQAKKRNVFMGYCYSLPFCRESIRARCPIFIKHRGPCWRYKQGCMCEESIAVLASTTGDWKQAVAKAMDTLEGRVEKPTGNPLLTMSVGANKVQLSWEDKKQRCRECVIYNAHQEQKYKLSVFGIFALTGAGLYLFNGILITGISNLFLHLNEALGHLSLSSNGGGAIMSNDISAPVAWFILSVFVILIISKLLQLVEYCCFMIKI